MSNNKKSKKISVFLILGMAACAIVLAVSAYMLASYFIENGEASASYEKLESRYVTVTEKAGSAPVYEVDFQRLADESSENTVTSSWIINEGTVINYPIAHGTDNSYYLNHMFDGTKNKNGAIFIDYRNAGDFSDRNTLIYGHHMKSGAMFASLVNYAKQSYYEEHPVMRILTPECSYEAQVFSAYVTPATGDSFDISFNSDNDFANYLDMVCSLSEISSGVEVSPSDRIVTLSTCTYEYDDARFLVHAKLVPLPEED